VALTYHDRIFLAPVAPKPKSGPKSRKQNEIFEGDLHGIGRSPRFAPGWWLAGTALAYLAIGLLCIFAL
jgi:hypothetical protein